jgi:signal transduction histidine kinase
VSTGGGRRRPARAARAAVRGTALIFAGATVGMAALTAVALVAGELPGDTWTAGPVLVAAATGAAVWPVARRAAGASADRLVGRSHRSPDEVVRSFATASGRDLPVTELLVQLAEALLRSFGARAAEMWRVEDGGLVRVVSVPERPVRRVALDPAAAPVLAAGGVVGRAWLELWLPSLAERRDGAALRVVPATHAGDLLGVVLLEWPPDADDLDPADDAALAELGGRAGVVLHNRQLDAALQATLEDLRRTNEELRASRMRLVATADAERRRIERDLHDGAQQHLVALAVNLRLAGDAIAARPATAPEVIGALGDDVRMAIAELRTLAHGIYPPLLADAGLVEALRVAADRSASPVTVVDGGLGRHASEVEAAVYFCCTEALQNAAKHAPGAAVRVHVDEVDGAVRFTVSDDGPGPGEDPVVPGHGLSNMTDRVGALGGRLTVRASASGGTVVAGDIPVPLHSAP